MSVRTAYRLWPLFFGLALIGLALGVQGSLLGLRANLEGFTTATIGLLMSAYYAGFLIGSMLTPRLISAVGHIRTFGAATALASITILVHASFVDPWVWCVMRFITGFAFSVIFVVAESWLNQAATNESRGQLLSLYMVTILAGVAAGQLMLNLADPAGFQLFMLISVMVSLAAIPILMTELPTPELEESERVSIAHLWRRAPLGVIGIVLNQWCSSVVFSFGAVYAARLGMSVAEIALFMGAIMSGAMFLQWPIGRISDLIDRRWVLGIGGIIGAAMAVAASQQAAAGIVLFALVFLFGGFCLSQYSIVVALIHDHLRPAEIVPASGTIVLVSGLVAISGPPSVALGVDLFGLTAFFLMLAAVLLIMASINLWRVRHIPALPARYKTHITVQSPVSPLGSVLHPEEKAPQTPAEDTDNTD